MSNRVLLALFLFVLVAGYAVSTRSHDIYSDWLIPGTQASCCHDKDCRPTTAYVGDDGVWRAWTGTQWLPVPDIALLPTDQAGDGRSHICEENGMLRCFSPTGPKF